MSLLIATHDSVTGEKGSGILSLIMTPFAKTQSKTLKQQYEAGCRMFDIRVKPTKKGWKCAHGLWTSKEYVESYLMLINSFKDCYICVTYEGKLTGEKKRNEFINIVNYWKEAFKSINWGPIAAKYTNNGTKVDWETIIPAEKWKSAKQGFLPLDGTTWQTYIPIPWLWNKIYTTPHTFDEDSFTFVDFL